MKRRKHLVLYPTVAETLLKIKGRGTRIIGYTESMAFYSNYRVRRLGLDGVLDYVFCPEDHVLPELVQEDFGYTATWAGVMVSPGGGVAMAMMFGATKSRKAGF